MTFCCFGPLVGEHDLQAPVQEGHRLQPLEHRAGHELGPLGDEHGGVRPERDRRTRGATTGRRLADDLHLPLGACRPWRTPGGKPSRSISTTKSFRQRVDDADTDAVEAAGHLVAVAAELAACVQDRQHDLGRALALVGPGRVSVDGDDLRPLSSTRQPPSASNVTLMRVQYPAMASSTELSTTSQIRWCNPARPVEPMYMPGRLRTGRALRGPGCPWRRSPPSRRASWGRGAAGEVSSTDTEDSFGRHCFAVCSDRFTGCVTSGCSRGVPRDRPAGPPQGRKGRWRACQRWHPVYQGGVRAAEQHRAISGAARSPRRRHRRRRGARRPLPPVRDLDRPGVDAELLERRRRSRHRGARWRRARRSGRR